jgi:hypothetical protein
MGKFVVKQVRGNHVEEHGPSIRGGLEDALNELENDGYTIVNVIELASDTSIGNHILEIIAYKPSEVHVDTLS